ncbi:MAG: S49 family peptidase [Clostridiales bacterium]|nr:S49 family peptidase [Clostridiales bacterium]
MGSYFEEFTEEQKKMYISVLEETYDQFVGVVAEGRGMNVEEVEYLADGRIYSPKQALDNGLIDGIMRYNDAVHQFIDDMNWSEQTQVVDFEPLPPGGLESLFVLLSESRKSDLETYLSHADNPIEGFAYYCEALG